MINMLSSSKLYYVYDPMCSWCWGYKPVWKEIEQALSDKIEIVYVLGGLAPDSEVPMPKEMQQQIAAYWKKIENLLGTQFNYEFWSNNTPRRSTYPACRAIIAARFQNAEQAMLSAIQKAYYLDASNPSDNKTLIDVAVKIGLNKVQFEAELLSPETHQQLLDEISFARSIGGNSFPSLFVAKEGSVIELPIDYQNAQTTIDRVNHLL